MLVLVLSTFLLTITTITANTTPNSIENYPWTVSLNMFGKHWCTGAIINKNTIVTAESCCVGLTQIDMVAVAGTTDASQGGTRIPMRGSCIPHESNQGRHPYNIAIIKLNKDLSFNERIQSVALPKSQAAIGANLTVTGWERESADQTISPNLLQPAPTVVVENQDCQILYDRAYVVDERVVCAKPINGVNSIREGHTGGPLATPSGELYGIAFQVVKDLPFLYTDVTKVREWILEKANE